MGRSILGGGTFVLKPWRNALYECRAGLVRDAATVFRDNVQMSCNSAAQARVHESAIKVRAGCCRLILIAQIIGCYSPAAADDMPDHYRLSYPAADRFCPPIAGFFDEVQRTVSRAGYHTFRHQPNGGYGLPVQAKIGDAHLLHLGADVGWHRVGEPVFAVAAGVVRASEGAPADDHKDDRKSPTVLQWGNLIVLEHRLPDASYATTIYGHLASERLVKVGDVVRAGQQIGTIGTARVNGGYKPHLHFGVRQGRMAEIGRKVIDVNYNGKQAPLKIAEVRDDVVLLSGATALPDRLRLNINGRDFELTRDGDKAEVESSILLRVPTPEFPIVGYGLSTDGWLDPIAFLRAHSADSSPAAFELAKRRPKKARASAK
jgi:murein DD-endopeptidase MepM/ murein hydrolase activator NlpD